jgi:hypothetical protein
LLKDPAVAGPLGTLAMSVVTPHAASLGLRALSWHRDLERLGVRMPFSVVQDLGLLIASPNEQLVVERRHRGELKGLPSKLLERYTGVIREVAESEAARRSSTLRLSDDVIVVLLARLLSTVAERCRSLPTYPSGVPLDAGLLENIGPQLDKLWAATRRTYDVQALEQLVAARLFVLTLVDALDLDTLQLFGVLGGDAASGALAQVDLLGALAAPQANDIVDFSLEILPSVLETKTRPGASSFSAYGYAGLARKGSIDSLVLTELAWDESELMRRMADDEVLYYSREQTRDEASRVHHLLIDASASMRGDRTTFARGMAIAVAKKLLLAGEDVTFRFFDSRLYEPHAARAGQLPIAYLLSFRGERGRNPARVFADFERTLDLGLARDPREPIVHLFTHGALYIPQETVAGITRRAKVAAVFMMPSGGHLKLDYLDLLHTHWVVDHAALASRTQRVAEAHRILVDVSPAGAPEQAEAPASARAHGAAPDSTRWRAAAPRETR